MDLFYKIHMFAAVTNVILTFTTIAEILIFKVPPPPATIVFTAFAWVVMILFNPFWKDTWKKK